MEQINIRYLKQRGKVQKSHLLVLGFEEFVNEALEVEVKNPNEVEITSEQDDVLSKVESKIEQVSGWDIDILMDYIADQFQEKEVTQKDLIQWIMLEINKYNHADINIKGETYIPKNKRGDFEFGMLSIDYQMMVEKIVRRLRGIEDDEEDTPVYVQSLLKLLDDCMPDGKDDNEEEEE